MIKNLPQSLLVMDRKWYFHLRPNEKDDLKNMEQNINLQGKKYWTWSSFLVPPANKKTFDRMGMGIIRQLIKYSIKV